MKKKIYISGAISKLKDEVYLENFRNGEKLIKKIDPDCELISPIRLTPHKGIKTWSGYMRTCINQLALCDEIYVMDNWFLSKGVCFEILTSLVLGIKIRRLDMRLRRR